MKILLNQQEQQALEGLPLLSYCLYVKAIKPRMDISSAMVGVKYRISWQALREWLYVEPHPGIKGGSPTVSQLRRAALWLEKAGLIKSLSQKKQLIFKCLLATPHFSALNKVSSKLAGQESSINREQVVNFNIESYLPINNVEPSKSTKADTHHLSHTNTKLYQASGDDCLYSFNDETIPTDNKHWLAFFIQECGFTPKVVNTIKALSLFDHWCQQEISVGLAKQAMHVAHTALGKQPDSPTYYRNFIEEWLRNKKFLTSKTNHIQSKTEKYNDNKTISRNAAERMWQACQSGLEGTIFE